MPKEVWNADVIDLQPGEIICFTGSQNTYWRIGTWLNNLYGKEEKTLSVCYCQYIHQNTTATGSKAWRRFAEHTLPTCVQLFLTERSLKQMHDLGGNWHVKFCIRQNLGRLLITVFLRRGSLFVLHKNFCHFSSQGRRALQWAPAQPSCFGVGQ